MKTAKLILISILVFAGLVQAQDLEPRAYANLPTGLSVLAMSFSWSQGSVITNAGAPIQDLNITGYAPAVVYFRTFNIFGKLGRMRALLPFAHLTGDAVFAGQDTSGTRTGLVDARLKLSLNLFGPPVAAAKDFRPAQKETILGVSLVVSMPVGQYDASKIINIGANRWGFKPEVGLSHRFGRWSLETYGGVWLFTGNSEFVEVSTLEQDPLYSFQWHVSYTFKSGIWLALNNAYFTGGETSVDRELKNDFQRNWRAGATLSLPLGHRHSIKALFHTGAATRVGSDFDIITIAYQYTWF